MDWKDVRVAVTGATGFIGGRLVERLVLEKGAKVRCLVRDYAHCAGLSRLNNVELISVDLRDFGAVTNALQECEVVVHCAYSWDANAHSARQANILGAVNLFRGSASQRCQRFVHLSTDAVHGFDKPEVMDETFPLSREGHSYIATKVELEKKLLRLARRRPHLPLMILRPAIVYGPGFNTWTTQVVRDIQAGRQFLVEGGKGVCNTTYVDNLVDAILLSCERPEAGGNAFLITDGNPLSWFDYVSAYAELCGVRKSSMSDLSASDVVRLRSSLPRRPPSLMSALASPQAKALALCLPWVSDWWQQHRSVFRGARGLQQAASSLADFDAFRALTYANRTNYSIAKARTLLGYVPAHSFSVGIERTAEWLRFARILPQQPA
jgi:nucleoside-diphosphate-sugar epimerase